MHLIGRQIGNYVIEERIGRGGMAAVYKAYQPGLDRHVAIKIMHSHLGDGEGFAERFQREARLMGRLQYPHIVRVVDAGTFHCTPDETQNGAAAPSKDGASSQIHCSSDTLYYLVLDYIEGGTLQDLLHSDAKLSIEQALDLTTQLADALVHMHDRGMMHRDIKPANILFADASHTHALLGDFGFARMIEQQAGQLTALGAIVGTPNYMSPEAVRGEPCDERSDVYSLGVVLYEILAGRAPYLANTPYSMMMKLNTEPLPPIREFNPAIPVVVEEILNRALAKEAADRFQSAAEFGDALLNARVALLSAAAAEAAPTEAKSAKVKEAKRPKAPKPAAAPKSAPGQPKRGLFTQRKGLTMVGSASVVLLCAWFTIVALLILEKSVGAVGATPVVAASPIQLQTTLALQASNSDSSTSATRADILNGGIVPTATEAQVAEVAAPVLPSATATATSTPLTRLTPAESDIPLTGTITISPSITTTVGDTTSDGTNMNTAPIDETAVETATINTNEVAEPGNSQPVAPVIEQSSAPSNVVTAVGIPVVITPLPQE
ncbi:MAG: protein kinase [Caldilineaceae bacterium]